MCSERTPGLVSELFSVEVLYQSGTLVPHNRKFWIWLVSILGSTTSNFTIPLQRSGCPDCWAGSAESNLRKWQNTRKIYLRWLLCLRYFFFLIFFSNWRQRFFQCFSSSEVLRWRLFPIFIGQKFFNLLTFLHKKKEWRNDARSVVGRAGKIFWWDF